MIWPFRRTTKPQDAERPTPDSDFHKYTEDLLQLTRLRERAMQAAMLKKPGAAEEVERYDVMIEVAQRAIIRLTRDSDKA